MAPILPRAGPDCPPRRWDGSVLGIGSAVPRIGVQDSMHRAFLAFLLAASIVPVLVVDTLPLHDFPVHYARLRMLAAYDHDPAFASHYERLSFLLPNIAFDAVVLALSSVMTVKTASQLFVAAAVLMCGIGVACLQRALFGELSLSVIAGVMLALNGILLWGFVNYLFGVGLMLLAFAAWVASRSRMLQLATGTAASLLLLFSHLVAFGLYALLVFGWEVEGLLRRRWPFARVAASGLQFVPATLLFLTMRTASEDPLAFRWVNHPAEKLVFIVRSLTTLVPPADLALGLAALVILAMAARRRLRLALDPRMRLPLSIVGLAFVALPFSMFGSYFLDARIPIAFFLLLAGSARLTAADSGARRRRRLPARASFASRRSLPPGAAMTPRSARSTSRALGRATWCSPRPRRAAGSPTGWPTGNRR
jgi:hypothetical protein